MLIGAENIAATFQCTPKSFIPFVEAYAGQRYGTKLSLEFITIMEFNNNSMVQD